MNQVEKLGSFPWCGTGTDLQGTFYVVVHNYHCNDVLQKLTNVTSVSFCTKVSPMTKPGCLEPPRDAIQSCSQVLEYGADRNLSVWTENKPKITQNPTCNKMVFGGKNTERPSIGEKAVGAGEIHQQEAHLKIEGLGPREKAAVTGRQPLDTLQR